jgi:hypothetical protein
VKAAATNRDDTFGLVTNKSFVSALCDITVASSRMDCDSISKMVIVAGRVADIAAENTHNNHLCSWKF